MASLSSWFLGNVLKNWIIGETSVRFTESGCFCIYFKTKKSVRILRWFNSGQCHAANHATGWIINTNTLISNIETNFHVFVCDVGRRIVEWVRKTVHYSKLCGLMMWFMLFEKQIGFPKFVVCCICCIEPRLRAFFLFSI